MTWISSDDDETEKGSLLVSKLLTQQILDIIIMSH